MSAIARFDPGTPRLQPRYVHADDPRALLGPHTLALFGFGAAAPRRLDDPRYLQVGLEPLCGRAPFELWHCDAPVQAWRDGVLAGTRAAGLEFGWIEVDEGEGGIAAAAREAYLALVSHLARSATPHLLRMWNYFDAITEGADDAERYRQFCVGRVSGLEAYRHAFPAGTAIGRRDGVRRVQVYWLAAADAGRPLENPRQVPAWEYPRQYGPRPPSFARAMLPPPAVLLPLMLSGTAAVVGHASHHPGDVDAQLDESFRNLDVLLERARALQPTLPPGFDPDSLLKVYLRDAAHAAHVDARLRQRLGPHVPLLLLHADICRRELLVEIDGFHGG